MRISQQSKSGDSLNRAQKGYVLAKIIEARKTAYLQADVNIKLVEQYIVHLLENYARNANLKFSSPDLRFYSSVNKLRIADELTQLAVFRSKVYKYGSTFTQYMELVSKDIAFTTADNRLNATVLSYHLSCLSEFVNSYKQAFMQLKEYSQGSSYQKRRASLEAEFNGVMEALLDAGNLVKALPPEYGEVTPYLGVVYNTLIAKALDICIPVALADEGKNNGMGRQPQEEDFPDPDTGASPGDQLLALKLQSLKMAVSATQDAEKAASCAKSAMSFDYMSLGRELFFSSKEKTYDEARQKLMDVVPKEMRRLHFIK